MMTIALLDVDGTEYKENVVYDEFWDGRHALV